MVSQLPQRVARILSVSGSLLCLHKGKPTVILIHYANNILFSQQIPSEQSKKLPASEHCSSRLVYSAVSIRASNTFIFSAVITVVNKPMLN